MQCVDLKCIWRKQEFIFCKQDLIGIFRCYPLFIIWTPGQSIGFIEFAGFRDDNKVICGKEQGPSRLSTCERLFHGKILQIRVVRKDLSTMFIALEIVAEVF